MESKTKKLILMRHGEAELFTSHDFNRQLTHWGCQQVAFVGNLLKESNWNPDLIIASNAVRTRETSHHIAPILGYNTQNIVLSPELYLANTRTILEIINNVEDWVQKLMIIGHNPTLSTVVAYLTQQNLNLYTASAACIHLTAERWGYVSMATGELSALFEHINEA